MKKIEEIKKKLEELKPSLKKKFKVKFIGMLISRIKEGRLVKG